MYQGRNKIPVYIHVHGKNCSIDLADFCLYTEYIL